MNSRHIRDLKMRTKRDAIKTAVTGL